MSQTESIPIQEFQLWNKTAAKRTPLSFDLEITARCNNNCRHCYVNLPPADPSARAAELTLAEIQRLASEAANLGALWCLITGGEPLIRPDFPEIYLALKRKGLLVSIFTTACAVTDHHVRLLREYPPRDIEVTVYGATRETYERVTRRPGSFDAFRRGLDRLFSAGVKVRLKSMALRSNLHEFSAIADFCRQYTADFYRFDPQLHLRADGNPARNAEILQERLSPAEIATLERGDPGRFHQLEQDCSTLINPSAAHNNCGHLFHCGAGESSFYVTHDARFLLCSSLSAPSCSYHLRNGSLADAWNNFVPRVRSMRSNRPSFRESCHVCPIVDLCLWCPAHAHLETGELDAPVSYFCDVAHARARQLDP